MLLILRVIYKDWYENVTLYIIDGIVIYIYIIHTYQQPWLHGQQMPEHIHDQDLENTIIYCITSNMLSIITISSNKIYIYTLYYI